ncbi:hypothetical protein Agub_g1386 [Astrephomene gubernaculifera]|uniref:F-box domain-containing protein n=1 Tax=Astrephomene gubernaculifera TaxID=47775 RepID=A0AAD3DHD3_9CHLO|nr:hypothetical protein Agub_g1386 [Astrephomene gubernaculifera]
MLRPITTLSLARMEIDVETSAGLSWPDLSVSVLSHVFGFLDVESLRKVCLVCKDWRDAGLSEPLWQALAQQMWPEHTLINASYGGSFRRLVLNRNARNAVPALNLQLQPHQPQPPPDQQPAEQLLPQPPREQPPPPPAAAPADCSSYWRANSSLRFYRCRLMHLEMQAAATPVGPAFLRLYFDARGERDLRSPRHSSLAVVRLREQPPQQQPTNRVTAAAAAAAAAAAVQGGAEGPLQPYQQQHPQPPQQHPLGVLGGLIGAFRWGGGGVGGAHNERGEDEDEDEDDVDGNADVGDASSDEEEGARGGPDLRALELRGLRVPNPLAYLLQRGGQQPPPALPLPLQQQQQQQPPPQWQQQQQQAPLPHPGHAAAPGDAGAAGPSQPPQQQAPLQQQGQPEPPQQQQQAAAAQGGGGGLRAPCSLPLRLGPSRQLGVLVPGQRASACWLAEEAPGNYKGCLEWSGPPLLRLLRALQTDPRAMLVFVYANVLTDLGYTGYSNPDYAPAVVLGPRMASGEAAAAAAAVGHAGGGSSFAAEWRRTATTYHAPGELLERLAAERPGCSQEERDRWGDLPEELRGRRDGWWAEEAWQARRTAAAARAAGAGVGELPRFRWFTWEESGGMWD